MKWNRFFWGIVFILTAAYLIVIQLYDFAFDIALWKIFFGVVFLYVLLESIGRRHIFGIILPLAGLYWLFAPYLNIFAPPLLPFAGAVILLCIGIYILFGRKNRSFRSRIPNATDESMDMDEDTVFRQLSFGRSEVHLHSKNLKEGRFICSFGDMHVYCTDAQLSPDGASMALDCSMGSLKLYVPGTWQIKQEIEVVLGNAQEKNRHGASQGPLLSITGIVKTGSIEIIYI